MMTGPSNVVTFKTKEHDPIDPAPMLKPAPFAKQQSCRHRTLLIDERKLEVECEDCGAMLNAVSVLADFMREESDRRKTLDGLNRQVAEANAKLRCKCQHCGEMTRIVR